MYLKLVQSAAFPEKFRLKYAVFYAKCGENLDSYTETTAEREAQRRTAAPTIPNRVSPKSHCDVDIMELYRVDRVYIIYRDVDHGLVLTAAARRRGTQ